jgi:hypothetical protein
MSRRCPQDLHGHVLDNSNLEMKRLLFVVIRLAAYVVKLLVKLGLFGFPVALIQAHPLSYTHPELTLVVALFTLTFVFGVWFLRDVNRLNFLDEMRSTHSLNFEGTIWARRNPYRYD